jgi:hypothetical protein
MTAMPPLVGWLCRLARGMKLKAMALGNHLKCGQIRLGS